MTETLTEIERNGLKINLETLKQIARMVHCKLGDFYDSKEEAEERAREHTNNS